AAIKPGVLRGMELGNPSVSLKFTLHDTFSSTTHTDAFPEICALVFRFYVPGIVREMADTLAAGGNFSIGKFRFTVRGVEIPKTKYLFFAGELQPVPWERVQCKGQESQVASLQDSADPAVSNYEPFSTANACAIEPLVQLMRQSPISK